MSPGRAVSNVEFKVDLVWKLVIIGMMALAGRLSWKAFEDSQETLAATRDMLHAITTRMAVAEFKIDSNTSRVIDNEALINAIKLRR